jgi:uncharacterized protein YggT (Ycf19 family)
VSNHAVDTLERFVTSFVYVYILLIFVWIVLSWVRLPYNRVTSAVRNFVDETVSPYMRIWRRLIPPLGGLDLSPILGIFVLYALRDVLITVLDQLRPS